ncbi:acyl-CoA dehydrogenase family protein [Sporosarcina sp. FSL K6-1522]|uniref:acyl-CoA dehydrogenase family protein n=1 Tax=Sporosarcina sp. FSL K6-1522 TaxID=2921554 RepID=UPI00315A96CD
MEKTYLKQEHAIFRKAFRKFLEIEVVPFYDQWEKDRIIPRALWKKMGEQGFLCPWLAEEYGGFNADFGYSVVATEEITRVGSSLLGFGLHNDVVVPYLNAFGNEEQKHRWLPGCVSGDIITAVAMTEPGAGSDLAGIRTTAVRDGDDYIINGEKTFITNGIHSDLVVVVCKTDSDIVPAHKGVSLIVVERDTPGFTRGKKLDKVGLHAQDTAELIFQNARVPARNLLGVEGKGFYYLMSKLQEERLGLCMGSITQSKVMLEITLEYVKSRQAFGQPIGKFQNTQFKLAEMATEIEIGSVFVDDLIAKHMAGEDIVTHVSMGKWWLTDLAKRVASECMQLHGGYGYMEEYQIARRYRDVPVASIYAGTNEIMKTIIAKNLGL